MTTNSFEKKLNKVIHNIVNSHRLLNMYQMTIDFGFVVDKYTLLEGYHNMIYWKIILYDLWLLTL